MHAESIEAVRRALLEDIGSGDITSRLCIPADRQARGYFLARQSLVLAGTELLEVIYEGVEVHHKDGETLNDGDRIATVQGNARTLLERERVALNFMQRLSGVATLASKFAAAVAGTGCKVLDTRKTTPGLRRLEKDAARAGGATNHRMGLFDAILIKNNHIAAAGGVRQAIENARSLGLPMEVEVRTRAELDEALEAGADHLLLDNLTPQQAEEWIAIIAGRAKVEISGGINLDTVAAYARTGADFVSAGAITHSAPAVDISFRLELLWIVWLKTTKSTMDDAAALALKGEPHGTAVIADVQTGGVGRHGNSWHSSDSGGLYISIILRMRLAPDQLPVMTIAIGLAVQRAVNEIAGVAADLRWPNDVMLNDRKAAGILVRKGDGNALIAGIGLNVNQPGFPPDLSAIATSMFLETGHQWQKDMVAEKVLAESLRYAGLLVEKGKGVILKRFEDASTWAAGKSVHVGEIQGVTAGVDENGFLLVRTDQGVETVMAGGVRAL